jgi:hypothetical protein
VTLTRKKSAPIITPEGHAIPGAMYGRVLKAAGGDAVKAQQALYKVYVCAKAAEPWKYIAAGIKSGTLWLCAVDMEYGKDAMLRWVEATFYPRYRPKLTRESVAKRFTKKGNCTIKAPKSDAVERLSVEDLLNSIGGMGR